VYQQIVLHDAFNFWIDDAIPNTDSDRDDDGEDSGSVNQMRDESGMGQESGHDEEVAPVVASDVSAEQFKLHIDRVARVDGNIHEILANPQEDDRRFDKMILSPKIVGEDERHEDLKKRAAEGLKKCSKWRKNDMSSFVDDKIYAIDEMPGGKMGDAVNKIHAG